MIIAVILSAGESSRMGRPKALLPIEGQKFIERIVGAIRAKPGRSNHRCLGSPCRSIAPARSSICRSRSSINPDYKSGQLSSLQAAIRHIEKRDRCDGMLVHLVDHPYIDVALVERMIERFYRNKKADRRAAP